MSRTLNFSWGEMDEFLFPRPYKDISLISRSHKYMYVNYQIGIIIFFFKILCLLPFSKERSFAL